jgi:hypothetical protein
MIGDDRVQNAHGDDACHQQQFTAHFLAPWLSRAIS